MINEKLARTYCCEDLSLIENYDKAIADKTRTWHCHHRLETDKNMSQAELIFCSEYYNVPASSLIFLTQTEHMRLHFKDKPLTEETKQKLSEAHKGKKAWNKGKHWSEEMKKIMSNNRKGKCAGIKLSEEVKEHMSESQLKAWSNKEKKERRLKLRSETWEKNGSGKIVGEKIKKFRLGKIWVNNGSIARQVYPD